MKIKTLIRKKIFAPLLFLMPFLIFINFIIYGILGFYLHGSALFKGKITPDGVYMVHSCGKYKVVSKKVFVSYMRYETITYSSMLVYILIFLVYILIFRESTEEMYANIDEYSNSIRLVKKLKKIDPDKFGCCCLIIVFICIFIYIVAYLNAKSRPTKVTNVDKIEDSINKIPNEIINQGHADQSDFFPPIEDSENMKQKSNNHRINGKNND